MSLREGHRLGKGNHEVVASGVRVLKSARNQCSWQVACAVLVKENVKRGSRPSAVIFSEHIHFGDLPGLAGRHDEIVSGLTIKKIQCCFSVLRGDVNGLLCGEVVILIVEDTLWGWCWRRTSLRKRRRDSQPGRNRQGEQRRKDSCRGDKQRGYDAQMKESGFKSEFLLHSLFGYQSPIRSADSAFHGRGGGKKRCRGVGRGRGVIVGVTFGVAVGVGVVVAVAVALGVAVTVGVGVGVGVTLGVAVGVVAGVGVAVGVGLRVEVLSPNAATVPSL